MVHKRKSCLGSLVLRTFKSEYEGEIEDKYDFSNLMLMSSIIAFQSNLELTVPCLTGPKQGGVRFW